MQKIKELFSGRPVWMNCIMLFCAYMTFIYMPFDMFIKSVEDDAEVWFGFMLTGWYAKATEPIHWLIYAFGLSGFLRMRSWMWPWAGLYVTQVALSMLLWPYLNDREQAPWVGILAATAFVILAVALLRSRDKFTGAEKSEQDPNAVNET